VKYGKKRDRSLNNSKIIPAYQIGVNGEKSSGNVCNIANYRSMTTPSTHGLTPINLQKRKLFYYFLSEFK